MSKDPFTLVYDAVWDTLEDHQGFRDLVREGNRVKFTGRDRDPLKDSVQDADLPEVRIVAPSITPRLNATSSTSFVDLALEVGIATGDKRLNFRLFPVAWEIIRALSEEELGGKLSAIEWNGRPFVVKVGIQQANIGQTDVDLNRGIEAWSAIWAATFELQFLKTDIVPIT